jgi:hypothetical protein
MIDLTFNQDACSETTGWWTEIKARRGIETAGVCGAASEDSNFARQRRHRPQHSRFWIRHSTIGGATMPEGILCNKQVVETKEKLDALLADKSGKQYYQPR